MNKYEFRDKLFSLQQCPVDIKERVQLVNELLHEYEPLKERVTPKKVTKRGSNFYQCNNCEVLHEIDELSTKEKFCSFCGQALDWSE